MNSAPVDPADPGLLSAQAPALAAAFASVASDIALVVDAEGIVCHVALGQGSAGLAADGWVGKPWAETVTRDSRRKVELLLHEAAAAGVSRRREVNHPGAAGPDVPMAYAALRLGERGPVLAVGRDLRVAAALQQRFVDAQREVGRERWQLRRAQSRLRLLGQVAGDAVMVVDVKARVVIEANPAAGLLFGLPGAALPAAVEELLAAAQRSRRATEIRTRIAGPGGVGITQGLPVEMSAIALRSPAGAAPRMLVRARRAEAVDAPAASPDAVVITDAQGHILMASPAFLALCRAGSEAQLAGQALGDVLGDPQRRLAALLSDVLHDGVVNDTRIALGPNADGGFEALLGAALIADGSRECIGITLRRWDRPAAADLPGLRTQALAELLGRLGSLPLDELARRAGQLAEQHALEAALQRSGGDRGRAAALLGLSQPELEKTLEPFCAPNARRLTRPAMAERLEWARDGVDWPNRAASRFVAADGLTWHVQVMGQGPVLLMLHGTGAATHSWRDFAPLLAERFTVVAPDLPGHGFTDRLPRERTTLPGMAQAIAALLRELALAPALALGHSAGAALCVQMALAGHIAPRSIVALNGALLPFTGWAGLLFAPLARALVHQPLVPRLFARKGHDPAAVRRLIASTGSRLDAAGLEAYARLVRSPAHVAGALDMMAGWDLGPLARALPRLKPPLLLVVGERDRTVPPAQARQVAAGLPGARVIGLPGLGHLAHEEQPREVAAVVLESAPGPAKPAEPAESAPG